MIKESKYCTDIIKKYFKKDIVMTNSTKCQICDSDYVEGNAKVRNHCHITGEYRGSAHKDCNINIKLNHKIKFLFYKLKNYDSHLIMQ